MAFGSFDPKNNLQPMAEINVTPMVDVMLVLLVIFIITAPLLTHSIKLDLPKVEAPMAENQGEAITLSIDTRGRLFWNNDLLTQAEFEQRLAKIAKKDPQPDLQIRADNETRYEVMAKVMSTAQAMGVTKLGFVTEPRPAAAGAAASGAASAAGKP
jgi:biopolymer transport protein ExbD